MAKSNILIKSKLKKARVLVGQNKLNEAKSLYIQIYKKSKSNNSIGLELAIIHRKLGEYTEAALICNNIIKITPNNALAHHIYGSALQCLNQYDAAIKEYKVAINLDDNLIEAHYFLGNIYQLMGNLVEAVTCYQKAIELRPDFYEALNNLAAALIELNRPIDAKKVIDIALKINPETLQILCNMASFHLLEGNLDKALHFANKAYIINPKFIDALKTLGKIHYQKSDYTKALDYFQQAYDISRDVNLTAYIAQILERRSEFDQASKLISPLIKSGNRDLVTLLTHSALSRKYDTQKDSIDFIESSIREVNYPDTALINLYTELGKHYDSLNNYDKAFENYEKANLLERELNEQFKDLNEIKQLNNTRVQDIDSWYTQYPQSFWEELPSSANISIRPVFVIGMFRSGTTLCEQILSSHPDVYGAGELPDINQISFNLHPSKVHDKSPESLVNITGTQLSVAADSYLSTLNSYSEDEARVVDKMPANFMHVGLISKIFPNAHIIHMVRDPRDVCLSMYFQRFDAQMTATTDLVELADYYLAYQNFMKYWQEVLDIKILNINYEELVSNQESVTRDMLDYCGLEWSDKCLEFYKSKRDVNTPSYDQVRKPIYNKSVARWKNYERHLLPLIERLGLV